jgi:ABC-2 type transport system permease protein
MSDLTLVGRQISFEQRSYWRNPTAAGFTFLFPIVLLLIFASLNSNASISNLGPVKVNYVQYYVPAIIAFGVMGACFTNLSIEVSLKRDAGILKRIRGTPLPPWVYLSGLIGSSVVVSVLLVALVTVVGVVGYGITFPGRWAALIVTLVIGAACFCSLGLAMTAAIPNAEAAPAVVNIVFFPLLAISGGFFPVPNSSALGRVASVFPVKHFINATFGAYDPRLHGSGFKGIDLLIMAVWGTAALILAVRRFRWLPRTG